MAYYDKADNAPIAEALTKIAQIVDTSESDTERMIELLDEIEDAIRIARTDWLANIRAAQEAELKELRALR